MTAQEPTIGFRAYQVDDASAIESLFVSVFSKSEGEEEAGMVGNLARDLVAGTDTRDLYGFVAIDGERIVGAIFFSRLSFEKDIDAFILAPVAVDTEYQGMGIGQALITHGLREIKRRGVKILMTYGAPSFYSKVGFHPLSQDVIPPPLTLSQPGGWLGQSLTHDPIQPITGRCSCVKALDNPAYW